MSRYEEGIKLIEERCGNGKDNMISLATIAMEPNAEGNPRPYIRDVDAYYEDGVFYVTTWAKSTKMQQIAQKKTKRLHLRFASSGFPEMELAKTADGFWIRKTQHSGQNFVKHLPNGTTTQTMNRMKAALFWQSASQEPRSLKTMVLCVTIWTL